MIQNARIIDQWILHRSALDDFVNAKLKVTSDTLIMLPGNVFPIRSQNSYIYARHTPKCPIF